MQNKEIRLASRPVGMPNESNFEIRDASVPQPRDGELLLRTLYISVDPYLRGRMREGRSYIAPFEVGGVIVSGAVGEVLESKSGLFAPGEIVSSGGLPWQLYSVAKAETLQKIDPKLAPISTALGILGMPGLTAYFGLLDIGKPKSGETIVVSGAAGAVGTVVCQIAKIKGCRVIGIAGSRDKTDYLLNELGIDVAINYKGASGHKSSNELREELAAACPNGVNVYFDNVGGAISDAVMPLITNGARIVICGLISIYNAETMEIGLRPQPFLLVNSALMQGFIITRYASRFGEGIQQLAQWLSEGKLKYAETIVEGFEKTPQAFIGLFKGENLGKQIVKVADPT
jgi:NADPH-dependent curcumin reductase CurA